MAVFARTSLAAFAFVVSFLVAAVCVLRVKGVGHAWDLLAYAIPLGVVMRVLLRPGLASRFRWPLLGFALACPVLVAIISYGRFTLTMITGLIALSVLAVIFRLGFGRLGKVLPLAWVAAFAVPVVVYLFDHALFSGRIFAFKWSRIEHPISFSPYEKGLPEVHGRKAIYVSDLNGADPAAVALVWGWSAYPEFVELDHLRPKGSLIDFPAIQKAIHGASPGTAY